jgi:lipoprotein-releasing system permease protein
LSDPIVSRPVPDAPAADGGGAAPAGAGHPAPPVFSWTAFVLVAAGLFGAVALAPAAHAFFGDRLGLGANPAAGLAALACAVAGGLLGAAAARAGRRLAF